MYIPAHFVRVTRNFARRNAINEFYDAINMNVCSNTVAGKSDEYMDGYCAAVAWYNEQVLKAKNEMLGDLTELSE